MKTMEIIHLRLAGRVPEDLVDIIRDSVVSVPDLTDARIYRNSKLENDLAIHLHREVSGPEDKASDVGIKLASLLKNYGMVSHYVWTECCSLDKWSRPDETG